MADNTVLNPGSGGDVMATDDIGGVKHPRFKIEFGPDGVATEVSAINPLPVIGQGAAANSTFRASTTEVTLALTVGVNRIMSLWKPAALTKNVYINKITLYFKATHTAGTGLYTMAFITADSVTGTALNIAPVNRGATPSTLLARQAPTASTLEATVRPLFAFTKALAATTGSPLDAMVPVYTGERDKHERITLRSGQAEGLLIYQNVTAALTGAPIVACEIEWEEV